MTVHTKVGDSLQIAATNAEANFTNGLHQEVTGLLEPVSTINAVNFFYNSTSNVDAAGDAKTDNYIAYVAGDEFDTNYGVNETDSSPDAVGYVDYAFYLKATNTAATAQKVYMSKCNLLYNGDALQSKDKAWRVAMFVQSAVKNTAQDTALASTNVKTILTPSGAANFNNDPVKAISAAGAVAPAALAYGYVSADNDITAYNQSAIIDANLAANATVYYKITIRLWLEGEDTSCNNETYADLKDKWDLDLSFVIGNATGVGSDPAAVNGIGSVANAVADTTTKGTVTLSDSKLANGEKPTAYKWYKANGTAATGTNNESANNGTFAPTEAEAGSYYYYCVVTTEKGNKYRTDLIELTATEA
jgi:hypothetical protein